jgi:hypothetical protein
MRDDRDDRDSVRKRRFPVVVKIAGIAWISFGGLIALNSLILSLMLIAARVPGGAPKGAILTGAGCVFVFLGLIAAAFIFVGVQTVRGTAPGTVGNGIGSIVFGLLNVIPVIQQIAARGYLQAGLAVLFVLGLIGAGILALVGTADYKAWRKYKKSRRRRAEEDEDERPLRRSRRAEEDEDDDRPRRRRDEEADEEEDDRPRRRRRDDDEDDEDRDRTRRRPSRDD